MTGPWWTINHGPDRDHASDGYSRYGAYLAQRLDQVLADEELDDPEPWTAWCWWVATPPVMRPGYVSLADPLTATLDRKPDTGQLAATVAVAAPLPPGLARSWGTWYPDLRHRLTHGTPPTALTTIEFTTELDTPPGGWTPPPTDPGDRRQLVTAAKHAARAAAIRRDQRSEPTSRSSPNSSASPATPSRSSAMAEPPDAPHLQATTRPGSPLRITFFSAKGGQGCTTIALAVSLLLSHRRPVDLTAHDPDEAATLAGRVLDFNDDHTALTPRLRLVADPRKATATIVVHDAGTTHDLSDAPLPGPDVHTYLVTRPCFLALRRATNHPVRPTGIILIHEPERAITHDDIETILGRPIVATIPHTPAVARAVDAALLPTRLPPVLHRSLRTLTESLLGPEPLTRRAAITVERAL